MRHNGSDVTVNCWPVAVICMLSQIESCLLSVFVSQPENKKPANIETRKNNHSNKIHIGLRLKQNIHVGCYITQAQYIIVN